MSQQDQATPLSERIRPDVEAAPWVCEAVKKLERENAELRKALRFYADGCHFALHDPTAWDTVSGEPVNFQEDDACTATVEDGSIAKMTLDKFRDSAPHQPDSGEKA